MKRSITQNKLLKIFNAISYFVFLWYYIVLALFIRKFSKKTPKKKDSIYFFAQFFPDNAGYHWRVYQWSQVLQKNGFFVKIGVATSKTELQTLYPNKSIRFQKKFIKRRFKQILESRKFEVVIVRRELLMYNDYGDLFMLKLLLHFHPQAILDFDDDISAAKNQPKQIVHPFAKLMLENGDNFRDALKMMANFMTGTEFLKQLVLKTNIHIHPDSICSIPTCVNYENYKPKVYPPQKGTITLGWLGSDGNYPLLDMILNDLERLSREVRIELIVIGGEEYSRKTNFPILFYPWSLETEIEHILKMDLGLMPLDKSTVSDGKAGFKLIQYMALGVVSLASAITVNKEIIPNSNCGFLVEDDWYSALKTAIENFPNFNEIGANARKHVINNYSFAANEEKYLSFIQKVQQKSTLS